MEVFFIAFTFWKLPPSPGKSNLFLLGKVLTWDNQYLVVKPCLMQLRVGFVIEFLREIEPGHIRQLHAVGYTEDGGVWRDRHAEPIQEDLFELIEEVVRYAPVQSIIVERDANFPEVEELAWELTVLERICESARSHPAAEEGEPLQLVQ